MELELLLSGNTDMEEHMVCCHVHLSLQLNGSYEMWNIFQVGIKIELSDFPTKTSISCSTFSYFIVLFRAIVEAHVMFKTGKLFI